MFFLPWPDDAPSLIEEQGLVTPRWTHPCRPGASTDGAYNRAKQEAGVVVVFCIVFLVGCGLIALWISKCIAARKNKKQPNEA